MGIRCGSRAKANGSFGIELSIDGEPSFGTMSTNINICPNCTLSSSSIFIDYFTVGGASATFTFTTITGGVGFPDCDDLSISIDIEGTFTGEVRGEEFVDAKANLELFLNDLTNEICITLSVGSHIITGCRIEGPIVDIDHC